jgi:hypothetical protein
MKIATAQLTRTYVAAFPGQWRTKTTVSTNNSKDLRKASES